MQSRYPSFLAVTLSFVIAAFLVGPAPASAQSVQADPAPDPATVSVLSRYAFHLTAEHLSGDDARFVYDTHFGGELDLIDYVLGRVTFYADYGAMLGERFRRFDPSHGDYILGGMATARVRGLEVGAGFHHESRHLSDRPKLFAIDWNQVAARVRKQGADGPLSYTAQVDLRHVVFKSYVDYNWDIAADARVSRRLHPAMSLFGATALHFVGTDGSRDRGLQTGFREEGGVRFEGRGAAAELFLGVDRRVDPDPLSFETATWFTVGFRLLSR